MSSSWFWILLAAASTLSWIVVTFKSLKWPLRKRAVAAFISIFLAGMSALLLVIGLDAFPAYGSPILGITCYLVFMAFAALLGAWASYVRNRRIREELRQGRTFRVPSWFDKIYRDLFDVED